VNTLRAKLIVLLAVVIVAVVGLLTGVLLYVLRPSGQHIEPVAEQVIILARIAKEAPTVLQVVPDRAPGEIQAHVTQWLRDALAARAARSEVVVTRTTASTPQMVSIRTGSGWIVAPIPDLPPPDGAWRVIASWLTLITLGAIAIAVFVAQRMVRPLELLEKSVASVGPDAVLPELPVEGPAEVKVMARALNSLSARLKDAMESRMRLIAAAGHDMRTPITRMRLRSEFVADADDRAMWLKDVDELERIADSAMALVRQELQPSAVETLSLDQLVAGVVGELRDLSYQLELQEVVPARVRGSPTALRRAFRNLLINAATHGTAARVRMTAQGNLVAVVIEDDGPGIPLDLIGRVFEPFFRADPARRQNVPGAGLGLTIAREIVRRAGGDILIANGEHHGLVQMVELPLCGR
jgi:signal transduction histidine kinase